MEVKLSVTATEWSSAENTKLTLQKPNLMVLRWPSLSPCHLGQLSTCVPCALDSKPVIGRGKDERAATALTHSTSGQRAYVSFVPMGLTPVSYWRDIRNSCMNSKFIGLVPHLFFPSSDQSLCPVVLLCSAGLEFCEL